MMLLLKTTITLFKVILQSMINKEFYHNKKNIILEDKTGNKF